MDNEDVSFALASASDGLFEWARLACAYIGCTRTFPGCDSPNKDDRVPLLDSMYKLILETIFLEQKLGFIQLILIDSGL